MPMPHKKQIAGIIKLVISDEVYALIMFSNSVSEMMPSVNPISA